MPGKGGEVAPLEIKTSGMSVGVGCSGAAVTAAAEAAGLAGAGQ